MPTPFEIDILMHYATHGDDHPRLDEVPMVAETVAGFVSLGLLAASDENDHRDRRYMATEGARVYLDALKAVPLPERRWVMPEPATRTNDTRATAREGR